MDRGKATRIFVITVVLVIGIYDLAALAFGWGTISRVVGIEDSLDAPTIPFAAGVTMGHLFWPQRIDRDLR